MSKLEQLSQEQLDAVNFICNEAGLLTTCSECDTELENNPDYSEAYAFATNMLTKKSPHVACFYGDLSALRESIRDYMNDVPAECPHCSEWE